MRRQFETGRSAIYAENGIAATARPEATLAALDMLRSGGNAIDAAVTAAAMLAVIEPQSTGIGGDCFVILAPKGGAPVGLNGSGRAPAAATLGWYRDQGIAEIAVPTPHAVTVPGAVDAWCSLLERHGTRSIEEVLQPAIRAAEQGFLVTPRVAADWQASQAKLAGDPVTRALFLKDGRAPAVGDRHAFPKLGATLRRIGKEGRAGFYEGSVADDLVARLRALGGLHTLDDFAATACSWVEPIRTSYRGYDAYQIPPNGQGIVALMILNVLEGYDYGSSRYSEADRIHLLAEAAKAAFARRDALVGDPDQVEVPVERLLSVREAERMRAGISLERAASPAEVDRSLHSDTTYFTVVDRDRNAVSFINSLFSAFGSAITGPESGVIVQNRGSSFRLVEGHPNAIAPRKRPMHTIIPGFLGKEGRAVMPYGVMGGHYQPVGHTTLLTGIIDQGLDPQDALQAPRSFAYAGRLSLERPIAESVADDLRGRGHEVDRMAMPVGGGQAIWIDEARGILIGGSEPRKDGCALGY